MKKILLTIFLFLAFCTTSFSAESVFIPDITTEQAKKAVTSYIVSNGWFFKDETNNSLVFEKEERVHDAQLYYREQLEIERLYKLKSDRAEKLPDGWEKTSLLKEVNSLRNKKPEYYNSWTKVNLQFVFAENNGVTVTTATSSQEIKDMIKKVFKGYYSYNIEYKIPLFKRHVLVSDTQQQSYYTGMNRIYDKTKITSINDKSVKDYKKEEIENLFNNCPLEKIKLESDSGKTYYILRTFIEPTYKQYL